MFFIKEKSTGRFLLGYTVQDVLTAGGRKTAEKRDPVFDPGAGTAYLRKEDAEDFFFRAGCTIDNHFIEEYGPLQPEPATLTGTPARLAQGGSILTDEDMALLIERFKRFEEQQRQREGYPNDRTQGRHVFGDLED